MNLIKKLWQGLGVPLMLLMASSSAFATTIIIQNNDGPGEGFNDPTPAAPVGGNTGTTIGQQRLIVFQKAADAWAAVLNSSVPIIVSATFDPLPCDNFSAVLGHAGPVAAFKDFAGAPKANTYYPSALANALAGTDLDPGNPDIVAAFNSSLGSSGCLTGIFWYYGLDGNAPANTQELYIVVLHELAHGLGFLTLMDITTGQKFLGSDDHFLDFLEDHPTGKIFPNMSDTERLFAVTDTGNLHWVGTNVIAAGSILTAGKDFASGHVKMYAPNPEQQGSSVSHWDTSLTPDELMEPIATPAPQSLLTQAAFKDMGWPFISSSTNPPPGGVTISINDISQSEGTIGVTNTATFTVSLSAPTNVTVTVNYATTNGTAVAGTDYTAKTGTLTFAAGTTSQTIGVLILPENNITVTSNLTFSVVLSNAVNATFAKSQGVCTILDNDTPLAADLVITANTNATALANALTLSGQSGLVVKNTQLAAHSLSASNMSSGLYTLIGSTPHTYKMTAPGVVLSTGNVLDYQTGPNTSASKTTAYGVAATAAQQALLNPITGNYPHYDVTELDLTFDVTDTTDHVVFQVVFGSEEYPVFVGSSFIDGFGIYLNGTNIAYTAGLPININHPAMAAMPGTELNGVLAPNGNPVLQFSAPIIPGSTNNTLTFIVADTSDSSLDTTVYISSLAGLQVLPPTGLLPEIFSFTPTNAPVGNTVTITGTNFSTLTASNIVYFGSVLAQVTSANSNQLSVTVPPGALYSPISVTVTGLTAYADFPFGTTFSSDGNLASNAFASTFDFTGNSTPYGIVVADFDGDGKPDLAVASFDKNTISIFRNVTTPGTINSGTFLTKIDLTTGAGPYCLAVADLNGDGKLDLVSVNYKDNTISVFRNTSTNGNISFTAKTDFPTGSNPRSVATADIDHDGRPDLIVANEGDGTISILRNQSLSGSLTTNAFAAKVDFIAGTHPSSVAVGDLDGDGAPDIVVANSYNGLGGNTVSVFRNLGNTNTIDATSLAPRINFATAPNPIRVLVADIDQDGKLDIVVLSPVGAGAASILRNTSTVGAINSSSFAAKVDFATGPTTRNFALADLDGDGRVDLVAANQGLGTLSVLQNISVPGSIDINSFAPRSTYATSPNPYNISLADLDIDGRPELIAVNTNGVVSVHRNLLKSTPLISWSPPPTSITYGTPLSASQLNASVIFNVTNVPGTIVYSPRAGTILNAGLGQTLTATFFPLDSKTFNIVSTTVNLDVTKAPLFVFPDDAFRVYGATNPTFTASIYGFVNGDDTNSITGALSLVTTAVATSPVNAYDITATIGTLSASNYDFSIAGTGTLYITPAVLTVTADNKQMVYGAPVPPLTASYSGFLNQDDISVVGGQPYLATTATPASTVAGGPYPITASVGNLTTANYTFTFVPGNLTVTKATLHVTADDKTRKYGNPDPVFTATFSAADFLNGDATNVISGTPAFSTIATATSPVGGSPYPITITQGSLSTANYAFSFINGNLTIIPNAPAIGLPSGPITYAEIAPAKLLDPNATVSDGGNTNFNNGTLTLSFVSGGAPEDRLGINNQGPGVEQIYVNGNALSYSGTNFASFSGGRSGSDPLIVTFNTNAVAPIAQALIRNLTYTNVSETPSTVQRVIQFVMTDGIGGTSTPTNKTVNVVIVNYPPTISLLTPTNGAAFRATESVVFSVTTADIGGSVAKVEYFGGTTLLGATTNAPFTFTRTNLPVGSFSITAKATDSQSVATTTSPISIIVNPAIDSTTVALQGSQFSLKFVGSNGVTYAVQTSSNLVNWTTISTIRGTSGAVPFVDTNVFGIGDKFYRIFPSP